MTRPTIVVAVPAYQAAHYLPRCVDGLRAAGFDLSKSVLVDDGSADATSQIAEQAGMRVVRNPKPAGASAARNLAAKNLDADLICFVDADVVVHEGMAKRIVERFAAEPDLDAVFGSYDSSPPDPGLVSRYRNLLHHYVHQQGETEAGTFWTGFGAVRREAFERLGGFDSDTENVEDVDFGMRLRKSGGRIVLDRGLLCTHLKKWTLPNMVRVDIFGRAVPWTRLILFRHRLHADLNLSISHRLNVALVALMCLAVPASLVEGFGWIVLTALIAAFIVANFKFFEYLLKVDGPVLALAAIPLHIIHYFCAGFGFALVWFMEYLPFTLGFARRRNRPG